jgi:hypothetical protein
MRRRLLMRDIDRVFELRRNMMDDWKYRGLDWRQIRDKYRVSKRGSCSKVMRG